MKAVIDASALLAHLLEESDTGKVLAAILGGSVMSSINFAEVATRFVRAGADRAFVERLATELPLEFVYPDEDIATRAAFLYPVASSFGLSLADRFCLATAQALRLPTLTADRIWVDVAAAANVEVVLIR